MPDPFRNRAAMEVDLIVLSRDLSPLRQDVLRGIERQEEVELKIHRVIGAPPRMIDAVWIRSCGAQ